MPLRARAHSRRPGQSVAPGPSSADALRSDWRDSRPPSPGHPSHPCGGQSLAAGKAVRSSAERERP
eukprot:1161033-Pyramimonas_sp.AAC.1